MKLLVSDFDGTVFRNGEVTSEDLNGINLWRKNGNVFAIATGRMSIGIVREKLYGYMDYLICENGAKIYDNSDNLIFEKSADIKVLDGIRLMLKDYRIIIEDSSYNENRFSQFTAWFENSDDSYNFAQRVESDFGDIVSVYNNRGECGIDIVPFGVGKTEAVYELLRLMKLEKDSVTAVGDGLNDIAMLKEFDGYIMESADSDIKEMIANKSHSISSLIMKL